MGASILLIFVGYVTGPSQTKVWPHGKDFKVIVKGLVQHPIRSV